MQALSAPGRADFPPRSALPGSVPVRRLVAAWRAAERGRFALWLPLVMTAGAIVFLRARADPPWWTGAAGCVGAALLYVAARDSRFGRAAAMTAFAAALGFASGQGALWRAPPPLDVPRRAVVVSGMVRAVEALPQGSRVTIDAPVVESEDGISTPASRTVRVRLRKDDPVSVETGDRISVRALLSRPSPPAYPGGWDLQRDAYFSGIGAYGFALRAASATPGPPPRGAAAWLQSMREAIGARVRQALAGAEAAVAITLLTGSTAAIAPADKAAFRDPGLAHLLAIAGLHIGIVMGFVFGAVRLGLASVEWVALRWPCKAIAAIAALAAGGGYMLLTGGHVPIIRSFAMACLFTLGVLAGRRTLSLRGWAIAMAALILLSPNEALGVSFQMSFSAVLALIAGYDALRPWLRRFYGRPGLGPWAMRHITPLALTSAFAGTASAPYGAYHFGHVQLYFVLANMVAVPLTAFLVLPLGIVALALMPLHGEVLALAPMGWGEDAVLWVGRTVAALPAATLAVPHMPDWGLALVSVGLAWLGLFRSRARLLGIGAIAAGLASPLASPAPDLLVSPDARLIGLRTADGAFVQTRPGASAFTKDAWAQMWAERAVQALPATGVAANGALSCDEGACRWRVRPGGPLVWIARGKPGPEACDADLVVAAEPVRLRCPRDVPVIDRFSVWREGAHAVWLASGGPRIDTELMTRGERPWAPPPGHARTTAGLTMAPSETLPGE